MPKVRDLRALRQSAMSGDCSAAKVLLKLYGYGRVALEIRERRPFTNRVRKTVDLLTAGTGTDWEWRDEQGNIHNDLQQDPPRGKARVREILIDD